MFEQTFKNIDDLLYKDSGADSELDYIGQTSWVMFLRYLDELEQDKADQAELKGEEYTFILEEQYRWPNWAMPKDTDGKLDHHVAMTGPDLVQFVDGKLFPYLAKFKQEAESANTIEYKIGEIFSELKNKIQSGYNLREILEYADSLPFRASTDKHELSHLYETKIKNMGNAGRNGGQYYTPRPLIRAMINVVDPQIGEKIYDGAAGSCGFLVEAYEYLYQRMEKTTDNLKILQEETLYGKEKKNLAYVIGIMNMILHGIEAPNIIHTNTLGENIRDIQEKNRYHVILANPPFGGKERPEVQQNFDIKTGETASLFLQHFIKSLKTGGRAAIVIKNTFLSNADNASILLRKYLLESCDLHTILDLPLGTFTGVGQKTIVLFFTKGVPTKKIWFYELKVNRSLGKRSPIADKDLEEFLFRQSTFEISNNSWLTSISELNESNYDLSVSNPNKAENISERIPNDIVEEIITLNEENNQLLNDSFFQKYLNTLDANGKKGWKTTTVGKSCDFFNGKAHEKEIDINGHYVVVNSKFISTEGEVRKFTQNQIFPLYINDVVLVMSDVPNGKALAKCFLIEEDDKYSLNQRICAIRSKNFNSKFLFYQLNRNKHYLKFNNGENQTNLRKADILDCPLIIPPIEIQNQIVEVLDRIKEITDQVEINIKTNKKLIDELKLSVSGLPFLIEDNKLVKN